MNFESLSNKQFKVKEVETWQHRFQKGITTVTLHLETAKEGIDTKDGKPNITIKTSNHYSEHIQKRGLTQPINSYVQIRRQISSQIVFLIKERYSNQQPKELHLLVYRTQSGSRTFYKTLHTYDEEDLLKVIGLIKRNNYKPIYGLFEDKTKLGKWSFNGNQ